MFILFQAFFLTLITLTVCTWMSQICLLVTNSAESEIFLLSFMSFLIHLMILDLHCSLRLLGSAIHSQGPWVCVVSRHQVWEDKGQTQNKGDENAGADYRPAITTACRESSESSGYIWPHYKWLWHSVQGWRGFIWRHFMSAGFMRTAQWPERTVWNILKCRKCSSYHTRHEHHVVLQDYLILCLSK